MSGNGECDHICTNNNGSFSCSCRTGYILTENNLSCDGKCFLVPTELDIIIVPKILMNVLKTLMVVLRHVLITMDLSCVLAR